MLLMIKRVLVLLLYPAFLFGQLYQGPVGGSVTNGVIVSTNSFADVVVFSFQEKPVHNKLPRKLFPNPDGQDLYESSIPLQIFNDPRLTLNKASQFDSSFVLKNFEGIRETNSIPPDPYIAVGPNHIMLVVNSTFRICDKSGNTLKTIGADNWFATTLTGASPFDPKVIYDHYSNRWVMVWLHFDETKKESFYLVSVSDDENPLGTWYNYAMSAKQNGATETNNWADYEAVGYDQQAIYITSNQWSFGTQAQPQYNKLRVIIKEQLYSNTAGEVEWIDFWDFKTGSPGSSTWTLRPARLKNTANEFYLLASSPFQRPTNLLVLYKLKNALSVPQLTVKTIAIANYNNPPNANQLGGSGSNDSLLIELGGSELKNEPIYSDGKLYQVFCDRNLGDSKYSSIRYVSIDVATEKAVEDVSIGANGFWYYYPAVAIDKNENVVITYSRSGMEEYAGAYYITRQKATGIFNGSKTLQPGKGNYIKDYSSKRNRWGDYNGIWNDPFNDDIWLFTEYAARTNSWGTWVGQIRLTPSEAAFVYASDTTLYFGNRLIATTSNPSKLIIKNFGYQQLQISSISNATNSFKIENSFNFPITISTYDSLVLDVVFNPTKTGNITDSIAIVSNDPNYPSKFVGLSGFGYVINRATRGVIYGLAELNTDLITINPSTGAGTKIGSTGIKGLIGLSVQLQRGELFALIDPLYATNGASILHTINASGGDAYEVYSTQLSVAASAFDKQGNLYVAAKDGKLYQTNEFTDDYTLIDSLGISISGITINPITDQMWASVGLASTNGKDRIYKINKLNGDTTFIGRTGTNNTVYALTFDNAGNLYGTVGSNINSLIKIDTTTGVATTIGSIGLKRVKGLAYFPDSTTGVNENKLANLLPDKFSLKQNYPNPFNPNTTIEYTIPFNAKVRLSIFNLLGEEVKQLENGEKPAGYYKIIWNSSDNFNKQLSSGIYFYRLTAVDNNGKEYKDFKKMILLK
ncbi:MAG: T9SS type A sorting domain-containing protein [Ignavibacteriales bacterium]|nr:T9SS type A sorting domain-containing protein [Ignavibacteriales bacterium]